MAAPKGIIATLVAGMALLAAGPALAAQCPVPPNGELSVAVKLATAPVTYRTDLDRAKLATIAAGVAMGRHGGHVMGLTVSNYAVETLASHQAEQAPDGRWCLWLRRIEAKLSIPVMTVYVASNYAQGSCQYRQILEHEHEHVRITEAALRAAGPRLEAHLRKAIGAMNPLLVSNRAVSNKVVEAAMARSVQSFMNELSQQADRANVAIDTKASYDKVASNCRKW